MNNFTSIFRAINRTGKIRIGSFSVHEGFQTELAKTGCQFIHIKESPEKKTWNNEYRKRPKNIIEIGFNSFKNGSGVDILLSHTISQQEAMRQLAKVYSLPHITLLHCYPPENWSKYYIDNLKIYEKSDYIVFTTEDQRKEWGCENKDNCIIINHAIDIELFDGYTFEGKNILTVANFYKERDKELNYDLYQKIKNLYPTYDYLHLGSSSNNEYKVANNIEELVGAYQNCFCFINTCHRSVLPTTILEAMSVGVPVISTPNPTILKLIKSGENGYIFTEANQIGSIFNELKDKIKRKNISINARNKILDNYNVEKFVNKWNGLFEKVILK